MEKIPKSNIEKKLIKLRNIYKEQKENYKLRKCINIIIYLKFLKKEMGYLERSINRK